MTRTAWASIATIGKSDSCVSLRLQGDCCGEGACSRWVAKPPQTERRESSKCISLADVRRLRRRAGASSLATLSCSGALKSPSTKRRHRPQRIKDPHDHRYGRQHRDHHADKYPFEDFQPFRRLGPRRERLYRERHLPGTSRANGGVVKEAVSAMFTVCHVVTSRLKGGALYGLVKAAENTGRQSLNIYKRCPACP